MQWPRRSPRVPHTKVPVWLFVIYSPQAESRRRRDAGQPRSAGFRGREEDAAAADAEAAAAERRRLQRVAVVRTERREAAATPPV